MMERPAQIAPPWEFPAAQTRPERSALEILNIRLHSLSIFRSLLNDPVILALRAYLDILKCAPVTEIVSRYGEFVYQLYSSENRTLAGYIQHVVNNDENAYIRMIGKGLQPWPEMEAVVQEELSILQAVADLTPTEDRGMKLGTGGENAELYEVINPQMACCLLEVEFHDQTDLASWIINNTEALGKAIADGIMIYRDSLKSSMPQSTTTTDASDSTTTTTTTNGGA